MSPEKLVSLLVQLTSIPSLSGNELAVLLELESILRELDLSFERIDVAENRWNIFASIGEPTTVLTTHVDVVSAAPDLFSPRITSDGVLIARGACDAKGPLVAMLAAAVSLRESGVRDFGLLFVVGEEDDGIGARVAATVLKNRGIRYLINGEPTDCVLASSQLGALDVSLSFSGRSVHSGYREFGEDANLKLIEGIVAVKLMLESAGAYLGVKSFNFGRIEGGSGAAVVSADARVSFCIRTAMSDHQELFSLIENVCGDLGAVSKGFDCPAADLYVPPGWESKPVAFCSDIPNFSALQAQCLMLGPGNILNAHTEEESISIAEIAEVASMYTELVMQLSRLAPHYHPG